MTVLRKRIKLDPRRGMFLLVGIENTVMPASSASLSRIYNEHRDEDGFLYMTIALENAFGQSSLF
ncbi:hypothetical protein SmJEL517_g06123 [Synchytrium microbalum]|uniref:Autophagy-related protein n=1 Tax=Synchytrium microbalum TaxID=1806994 RepID=A0A507BX21_9FUNG|nr:uncharacterized protein SmJEL517_g06123 [Synchytrium microbalum]TPX30286.1 hypothetical protein SmJEL517_g06123 [Synchytrium microbalum]